MPWQKTLIEAAYRQDRLPVWTEDEAGPYPILPYPGAHRQPLGLPTRYPHDYLRDGTAKQLHECGAPSLARRGTCRHPRAVASADGGVECRGKSAALRITLPEHLPPLRLLLVLDNLTGHLTPSFVLWLFAHGVMPLYTPLSGSWLNLPKGHPRKRSSASSSDGRWMGITDRHQRRSSAGWKRLPTAGIGHPRHLCGVASAQHGEHGSTAMCSRDQQRVLNCRSTRSVQNEGIATFNTSDPLVGQLSWSSPFPHAACSQ